MRTYILNNQIANDQLNVDEEDAFLRKLNDQLREGTLVPIQLSFLFIIFG
jgi:hypothetical protein